MSKADRKWPDWLNWGIALDLALMVSSSTLDGGYMAKWMLPGWGLMGHVLNLVADVTVIRQGREYKRLQKTRNLDKREGSKWARHATTVVSVFYSWFFSWRYLIPIVRVLESDTTWWWLIAMISAGFVPSLLLIGGYLGKVSDTAATKTLSRTQPEPELAETVTMVAKVAAQGDNGARKLPRAERLPKIKLWLERNQDATNAQIGATFHTSAEQARKDRATVALEVAGNGRGGNGR